MKALVVALAATRDHSGRIRSTVRGIPGRLFGTLATVFHLDSERLHLLTDGLPEGIVL